MGKRLFVGNISFNATEDDLRTFFAQAGEVVSAKLIIDRNTGKLRGFGFVEMSTRDQANAALSQLNNAEFMSRKIVVTVAKPKEGYVPTRFTAV